MQLCNNSDLITRCLNYFPQTFPRELDIHINYLVFLRTSTTTKDQHISLSILFKIIKLLLKIDQCRITKLRLFINVTALSATCILLYDIFLWHTRYEFKTFYIEYWIIRKKVHTSLVVNPDLHVQYFLQ